MGKWYLITSESYDSLPIVKYPMWNLYRTQLFVSSSDTYSGSYLGVYDDISDVNEWIYDSNTKEERYWNPYYEDPDSDPYGIDGPFPEEMDETIV